MIVMTTAMIPSTRSSVPTEIPTLAPLEDVLLGSSDNTRAPSTRVFSYIIIYTRQKFGFRICRKYVG
jgi:hypothetical protein